MTRKDTLNVEYTPKDIIEKIEKTNVDLSEKIALLDEKIEAKFNKVEFWSKKAMLTAGAALSLTVVLLGFLFSHMNG